MTNQRARSARSALVMPEAFRPGLAPTTMGSCRLVRRPSRPPGPWGSCAPGRRIAPSGGSLMRSPPASRWWWTSR